MGLIFGIVVVILGFFVAAQRKPPAAGSTSIYFEKILARCSVEETLRRAKDFAKTSGYQVRVDEPSRVVLELRASVMNFGKFFPIEAHDNGDGTTLVRVSMMDKLLQTNDVYSQRQFRRFVDGLTNALP